MARLDNTAVISGIFNTLPISDQSDFTVFTSAILANKTATPVLWTNGELTYTVTAENSDPAEPPAPVTAAVMTDIIDPAIAELVTAIDAVQLDGVNLTRVEPPAVPGPGEYSYNTTTGMLTVALGDLNPGAAAKEVTFRVNKKA